MNRLIATALWLMIMVCTGALPAAAYVGPGAGITLVGALWAVVAAVALALIGVLIWPLRALIRRLRGKKPADAETGDETPADGDSP